MTALAQGRALARSWWTRVRAMAHPTIDHAAHAAGVDRSHLSRWESDRCDHPVPIAVLWCSALVPDGELDALIAQVRADRAGARERAGLATPEGAVGGLVRLAAELIAAGVPALLDGRLSASERRTMRPALKALAAGLRTAMRALDDADDADATGADVVPLNGRQGTA